MKLPKRYLTNNRKKKINTITGLLFILAIILGWIGGELNEYLRLHPRLLLNPSVSSGSAYVGDGNFVLLDSRQPLGGERVSGVFSSSVSAMVEKNVERFAKTNSEKSYLLYLAHCLLYKETHHGSNSGLGDGGLAGGIAQFHQATFTSYRLQMQKEGLIDHLGSRFDDEDAIETMVWALANKKAGALGPVQRGFCKR